MGILVFIFGLIFGSFANVVIYRLPKGKSIVMPGSRCPACNKDILWHDNMPLLSYLFLRGKCRFCKKHISARYCLVEFISGLLFLLVYLKFGMNINFFIYVLFVVSMLIMGFIDIDTYLISDVIVLPGIVLGLACSAAFPQMHCDLTRAESVLYSLAGIFLGAGLLLFLGIVGKILFRKEAMGGGDVKLLAMIGAFLGWKSVFMTIFFSSLFGSIISITLILLKKKTMEDYVPFGPYLGLGAVISMFYKGSLFIGFLIN